LTTSRPPQYEIYPAPPMTTTMTTNKEEYFTQPKDNYFVNQSRI
uniref:Tax protein n=1 Tax=Heligmosomoides polygyrus TaxID=6339 RepID=A0A183G7I9_HELPZ